MRRVVTVDRATSRSPGLDRDNRLLERLVLELGPDEPDEIVTNVFRLRTFMEVRLARSTMTASGMNSASPAPSRRSSRSNVTIR